MSFNINIPKFLILTCAVGFFVITSYVLSPRKTSSGKPPGAKSRIPSCHRNTYTYFFNRLPKVLVVGNIGCGKSSLLEFISKHNNPDYIYTKTEPLTQAWLDLLNFNSQKKQEISKMENYVDELIQSTSASELGISEGLAKSVTPHIRSTIGQLKQTMSQSSEDLPSPQDKQDKESLLLSLKNLKKQITDFKDLFSHSVLNNLQLNILNLFSRSWANYRLKGTEKAIICESGTYSSYHIFGHVFKENEPALFKKTRQIAFERNNWLADHIIYLRTSPEKALERIQKRGRTQENITDEYVEFIHALHNRFEEVLNPAPKITELETVSLETVSKDKQNVYIIECDDIDTEEVYRRIQLYLSGFDIELKKYEPPIVEKPEIPEIISKIENEAFGIDSEPPLSA